MRLNGRERIAAIVGGVDTQDLLPIRTPGDVAHEVRRLRQVFGERLVVSLLHQSRSRPVQE